MLNNSRSDFCAPLNYLIRPVRRERFVTTHVDFEDDYIQYEADTAT